MFRRILLKLHNVKNPNRMMFVPFCSKWSAHFWFLRTAASSKELKRRMTSYIHNLIMVGWSFTSHWVINPQNHSIYIKRVSFYHLFSTLLIQFKLVYGLFWQSNMYIAQYTWFQPQNSQEGNKCTIRLEKLRACCPNIYTVHQNKWTFVFPIGQTCHPRPTWITILGQRAINRQNSPPIRRMSPLAYLLLGLWYCPLPKCLFVLNQYIHDSVRNR